MDVTKSGIKKKKFSKKRKSAWRKHVQVKEVEQYFQDARLEERLCIYTGQEDDGLQKDVQENVSKKIRRSKDDAMRCHATPSMDDHIKPIRNPAPNKAKVSVDAKPKYDFPIKVVVYGNDEEDEDADESEVKETTHDIWSFEKTSPPADNDVDALGKKIPVKPTKRIGKKPNRNPAVPLPMAGSSYRPTTEDHQELITKAYEVEMVKEGKKKKIINATVGMFPTKEDAPTEETWLMEMSEGLPMLGGDDDDDDNDDGDDDDEVNPDELRLSCNPPVRREDKKTERERKKMKGRKLEEEMKRRMKEQRIKDAGIFKLKSEKEKLKEEERRRAIRASWKRYELEANKNVPMKVGKARFVEPDLDLKLSDELCGSLRHLKPEGHILQDLVHSIQRRNMMPASRIRGEPLKKQRRFRPKVFEKASHLSVTI